MSFVGQPLERRDGRAKVTGSARYATEGMPAETAFAVAVGSTIGAGKIKRFDLAAAQKAPGVLAVITHESAPKLARPTFRPAGQSLPVLQGPQIEYHGQYIALVVAETFEEARHAASLVRVEYEPANRVQTFEADRKSAVPPPSGRTSRSTKADNERGDLKVGGGEAEAQIEAVYVTPIQHHCALEPHATLAWWEDGKVHAHDSTEGFAGTRQVLAEVFQLPQEDVHVFADYVGGSFGGKGQSWPHVILAALAARQVGRPVRLAPTRRQVFANAGHRAPTEQRFALGAKSDGALTLTRHETVTHTSQMDEFVEPAGQHTEILYACPHLAVRHRIVRAHVGTPTYTRGPGETPGSFALECAMDELAVRLGMDPVALRRKGDTQRNQLEDRAFSTRRLKECLNLGVEKFGWLANRPAPRLQRDGRWLIGQGMAVATLGAPFRKAEAKAILRADGLLEIQCGAHEIGVGNYTILAQIAADAFGLPLERVRISLGDSRYPPTPRGGSSCATGAGTAVHTAAKDLRQQLLDLARTDEGSPLRNVATTEIGVKDGWAYVAKEPKRGEDVAEVLRRRGLGSIETRAAVQPGPERGRPSGEKQKDGATEAFTFHSFGAHFCEVRVDEALGLVRVSRWLGVFDCGRILNPRLARAQIEGGVVWGLGNALFEGTEQDPRSGALINANLAEYHLATQADIPPIEVHFLDQPDERANPLGIKSIGELGNVGSAAAVANAIFHATGRRIRELPITPDKIMVPA